MVVAVNLKGFFRCPPSSTTLRSATSGIQLPQWLWNRLSTTTNPFTGLNCSMKRKPNLIHFSTPLRSNAAVGIVSNPQEAPNETSSPVRFDEAYMQQAGLLPNRMPKHVAVILDGCRRWSEKYNNGKLTYMPFYNRFLDLGDVCIKVGIPAATWFIFATCTLKRGIEHNNIMFTELQDYFEENLENFVRKDIKVSILGQKWKLPKELLDCMERVEEATKNGKSLHMIYAIPYGGRWEITEAARSICRKVMAGEIQPEDIDEALVEEQLPSKVTNVSHQDLMIRSGGKQRLSNFYLWQSAYADQYFSNHLLAFEFGEPEFLGALRWFHQCVKRFGK